MAVETAATATSARNLAAPAAALVAVTLWASAFVGIRSAGHHFQPGGLALGRLFVGSIALGLLVLVRREPLPPRRALCPGSRSAGCSGSVCTASC